jgi:HemY protein
MRLGVAALLAVLLGAFLAHFLLADRGYVLVNFRGYVVEMSVPGLVIVLVAAYLFVRALVAVAQAPRRWREGRTQRQLERRDSDLAAGLAQLVEGNWARSERLLTQGVKQADAPLANYLLAAHAAQLQGAAERRDQWLELAQSISKDGATSAQLTRAQLQLQAGDATAAVATLKALGNADQPAAVALLARAYRALDDHSQLLDLLPHLARASLPPGEREQLAKLAVEGELSRADLTAERLAEVWGMVPSELRSSAAVVAERALALERLRCGGDAERELRAALKREWHPALVHSYGQVRGADVAKQLKHAEGWLKAHPDDAALLTAAARLSMANDLPGKARSYLESSLALAPAPDAYALYGRLLTELGEDERASLAFRSGLALVSPAAAAAEPQALSRTLAPPARDAERKSSP